MRTRTIGCVTDAGATAQLSQCPAPSPATTDSCNNQPCPSYYSTGAWSACSPQCGVGSTSRTVECRSVGDESLQSMSSCASLGPAPASTASCSNGPCPQWKVGAWSVCGENCGDSYRNRTVSCINPDTGVDVNPTSCPVPVPPSTEPCNLGPCAHWHKDNWSPCSAACSGGTQTRGIRCRMPHDNTYLGQLVPEFDIDRLCPSNMSGADSFLLTYDPLPTTIQSCNTQPCAANFWRSTYGPCSTLCGNGTMTVSSVCVNPALNNTVVPDAQCIDAKPAEIQQCNTNLCPRYEWRILSEFTECSTYCSAGVSTRHVICVNANPPEIYPPLPYETVDDSFCASLPDRPAKSLPCGLPESVCFGPNPSLKTGICRTGQCVCRAGWSGANCTESNFINQITTTATSYSAGVPLSDFVQIAWASGAEIDRVSVMLVDGQSLPVYIAANISNQGSFFWQFGSGLKSGTIVAGGSYRFRVFFSPLVFNDSAPFTAANPCASMSCGSNGQCVNGQCNCQPAWTGATCSTPLCSPENCGADHGSCNAGTGRCDCKDGFSGPACRTPPTCPGYCVNGDFPVGANTTTACQNSQCSCPTKSSFTGLTCNNCSLSCANSGRPDANCQTCQCTAGYFGANCQCQYWRLTFRASPPVNMTVGDVLANLERYGQLFIADISAATGVPLAQLEVDSLSQSSDGKLIIRLRLKGPCSGQTQFRLLDAESVAGMQANLDLIKVSVSTQLSPLFLRYTTSQLDRSSSMQVEDPSGQAQLQGTAVACDPFVSECQQPASGSKGGISVATIGIIVGCVVGGIVLIGAGIWFYRSKSSGGRNFSSSTASKQLDQYKPEPVSSAFNGPVINNPPKRNLETELTSAVPPARPGMPPARPNALPVGWTQHVDSNSGATCTFSNSSHLISYFYCRFLSCRNQHQ